MTNLLSPTRLRPDNFIKRWLVGGTASVVASVAITNLLRVFSSMTLTRLLDSTSYGVVGIVTSVAYVIAMLTDAGILPFVIRHSQSSESRFLDEVWTIRLARGIALTVLMVVLARPISLYIGKPDLEPVVMVWSSCFLLDGLSSLIFATAVRDQRLWRISVLDTLVSAASVTLSILAALVLRNYWSMMVGMIGSQAVRVVLSYTMFNGSRRRVRFSKSRAQEVWRFSRNIALSSMLSLFIFQVDKVLLARIMPLTAFGLYAIATTLAAAPEAVSGPYCGRVLYPTYAKAAAVSALALRDVFYTVRRQLSYMYAAAVGFLIGFAPALVSVLYDPRYSGVAPILQILGFRVLLRMPNLSAYEATIALGDTRVGLLVNVARATWLILGAGTAAWLNNPWIMIVSTATDEIPATLWFWHVLRGHNLLSVREELAFYGMAGAGLMLGIAGSQGWFFILAH